MAEGRGQEALRCIVEVKMNRGKERHPQAGLSVYEPVHHGLVKPCPFADSVATRAGLIDGRSLWGGELSLTLEMERQR